MGEVYPSGAEEPEVIDVAWDDEQGLIVPEIPEIPENINLGEN